MDDKELHKTIVRLAEQAHMAGQYFAGTDPSYSEARRYCLDIDGIEFVNELQQENTELKSQLEALQAHVNTLLSAITFYAGDDRAKIAKEALRLVPEQSLNHIKARVEEETIGRCATFILGWQTYRPTFPVKLDGVPRKYAKQEKKEGE